MSTMSTVEVILSRIAEHCRDTGIAETTFGRKAVNDGKLVARLRAGKSIQLDTLQRIEKALSPSPQPEAAE